MSSTTLYERIGGSSVVNTLVDRFYDAMLDDYRINRFFNNGEQPEQRASLKNLVTALLGGSTQTEEQFIALMDDFFQFAFARHKGKSMVTGADWGFFGYIIEQDHPSTKYLSDSHYHLLRFMPGDLQYDAVIECLTASLQQLPLDPAVSADILTFAESGRNPVLGK